MINKLLFTKKSGLSITPLRKEVLAFSENEVSSLDDIKKNIKSLIE